MKKEEAVARNLRVVNDTNIWLSALYFSGKPAAIVKLIENKDITSVTSNFILQETKEKMIVDFKTPTYAANGTIAYIASISEIVSLKGKDFGLRDKADNYVLETAIVGKCKFLITGDKDLLSLEKYEQVNIIKPAEFLSTFKL